METETKNYNAVIIVVVIALVVFLVWFFVKKVKHLHDDNLTLVTGGVKCGKTTFSVYLALKQYRKQLFSWKFHTFVLRFLNKTLFLKKPRDLPEMPLLYSNIPLSCDYVPLTYQLMLRMERFRYKSVVLVSESSLVADSMDFKDSNVNDSLTLLNKLFGHETHGGYLYYETQAIKDNHYSVKRCLSKYYWINYSVKWVPFVLLYKVREIAYSDDNTSIINTFDNSDTDDNSKWIIVPKRTWKSFDTYCYSCLTDNLPCNVHIVKGKELNDLKAHYILRLQDYFDTKKSNDKKGGNSK